MKYEIDKDAILYITKSIRKSKRFVYYIPFVLILLMLIFFYLLGLSWKIWILGLIPVGLLYLAVYSSANLPLVLLKNVIRKVFINENTIVFYCDRFPEGIVYPSQELTEIPFARSEIFYFDKYNSIKIFNYKAREVYLILDYYEAQSLIEKNLERLAH